MLLEDYAHSIALPLSQHAQSLEAWAHTFSQLGYQRHMVTIPDEPARSRWLWDAPLPEATLSVLATHPDDPAFTVLCVDVLHASQDQAPTRVQLERWLGALWRSNRSLRTLALVLAPQRVTLSLVGPKPASSDPSFRHIFLHSEDPQPLHVERLRRLAIQPQDTDAFSLARRLHDELRISTITRDFFRHFQEARTAVAHSLTSSEALSAEERQSVSLILLNRLLFLHFVQQTRILANNHQFLRDLLRSSLTPHNATSVYTRVFKPLFFQALNQPTNQRPTHTLPQPIPYLNGGLFEPSPVELKHPQLDLPDTVLIAVFERLFDRYLFVVGEHTPGAHINPEMLGRVFEGLMSPHERSATGTFYTPPSIVPDVVRAAFQPQLQRWGATALEASSLLDTQPRRHTPTLTPQRAQTLLDHIDRCCVADLSCGSGAFLLGALHALEHLHTRLRNHLNLAPIPPDLLRRRIIARNLYGVDLQPDAVHLCTLRLWLSVIDVAPKERVCNPLPNIDHRVRLGDSLLEPSAWIQPNRDIPQAQTLLNELEDLKHQYASSSGDLKKALRASLKDLQSTLGARILTRHLDDVQAQLDSIDLIASSPSLFEPHTTLSPNLQRQQRSLQTQRDELQTALQNLQHHSLPLGFIPSLHFPEVLQRGGFDIVLGNPPWVRVHSTPKRIRNALTLHYDSVRNAPWTAQGMLSHLRSAGSQTDLSTCFIERAIHLLQPQGTLAFLVPSKLFRALYGGGIRRVLMRKAPPILVRELPRDLFPNTTTYPSLLVANTLPTSSISAYTSTRIQTPTHSHTLPLSRLSLDPHDPSSPFILTPRRRPLSGFRLGTHPNLTIRRGLMTGCNSAFLHPSTTPPNTSLSSFFIPALRGGDVEAWSVRPSSSLLWTHDAQTTLPLSQLPPSLLHALQPHKERLKKRSDLRRKDPWWRIFRVHPSLFQPKVIWRDISINMQAVALPSFHDAPNAPLPLNTVYFIPTHSFEHALVLAAWLNSEQVREQLNSVAEHAANNYRRFFAWTVSLARLPHILFRAFQSPQHFQESLHQHPSLRLLLETSRTLHTYPSPPHKRDLIQRVSSIVDSMYK